VLQRFSTTVLRAIPDNKRLCRIQRSIYEKARDVAWALAKTEDFEQSRRGRKRVEMLFAHLKRILRLDRLRLRGLYGAQFEFALAAIAQNRRRLAELIVRPPPATEARF
jgi:Transposase DDE domain